MIAHSKKTRHIPTKKRLNEIGRLSPLCRKNTNFTKFVNENVNKISRVIILLNRQDPISTFSTTKQTSSANL